MLLRSDDQETLGEAGNNERRLKALLHMAIGDGGHLSEFLPPVSIIRDVEGCFGAVECLRLVGDAEDADRSSKAAWQSSFEVLGYRCAKILVFI